MNGPFRAGLVCVLVSVAAGCGDNAKACGPGTVDEVGLCVPEVLAPPQCTGGTILDAVSNMCVIDPTACQDGTVLINRECRDPTSGLTVDVIEGPEPNGFGLGGEPSLIPAGELTLTPVGAMGVVLKGNLAPQADRDDDGQPEPDVDTYVFDVDGPTLLEISADGVAGIAGGFLVAGTATGLTDWVRIGVNLTGDTALRRVYLPTAGRYLLAIADTRSLVFGAAVGDADAAYYVTVTRVELPAADQLTASGGQIAVTSTTSAMTTRRYAVPLEAGRSELTLSTDHPHLTGGLVLAIGAALGGTAAETKPLAGELPAVIVVDGLDPTELALVVVDPVISFATQPVEFELHIETSATRATSAPAGPRARAPSKAHLRVSGDQGL